MKVFKCVEVKHHRNIDSVIEDYQKKGWYLHTYQATSIGIFPVVLHYLLFEKSK